MGWSFRRSVNLGPFRMNFSKSGIGYSFGVKNARIGRDARGRKYSNVSIPGTGIYRRDYYSPSKPGIGNGPAQNPITAPKQAVAPPNLPWRSIIRSPWVLYGGGGVLLYALLRSIF